MHEAWIKSAQDLNQVADVSIEETAAVDAAATMLPMRGILTM